MEFYDYLTDFIFVEDEPEQADVVFIPGGPYGEIAQNAALLYQKGYAPCLIPSGKHSVLKTNFSGALSPAEYVGKSFESEADFLTHILLKYGVPPESIYPERNATFTYENAIYTRKLTDSLGLVVKKALLSCQAYHARRCLLYYQALFPETKIYVCPVETRGINRKNWHQTPEGIDLVLGEVERCGTQFHDILKKYPDCAILTR